MRDLTKWPRLIVVPEQGHETVTPEQAGDILLRTDGSYFSVNDKDWPKACADVLGIASEWKPFPDGGGWWNIPYGGDHGIMAWQQSIGALDLHYLRNHRIMSSWIGGPHGWLDWDGQVGCSTWNIGKWPSYEEVSADWEKIAAAFPYLDLHAQLITDEGDGEVAGQWRVTGGQAAMVEPTGRMQAQELSEAAMLLRILGRHGERGVPLERLAGANARLQAAHHDG